MSALNILLPKVHHIIDFGKNVVHMPTQNSEGKDTTVFSEPLEQSRNVACVLGKLLRVPLVSVVLISHHSYN